jgi:hypothetical protein
MAGDAKNTNLWQGADIYIAPAGTAGPVDVATAWAAAWLLGGLLDGEDGFVEGREDTTEEHYAWGGLLYKRAFSKHKRTFKFTALEDNDVIWKLVNPGSTARVTTGSGAAAIRTGTIKVPQGGSQFAVGFEVRDGAHIKRRFAKTAEVVSVEEVKESETEPTVYEITVVVFPESDGTLYRTVENLNQ